MQIVEKTETKVYTPKALIGDKVTAFNYRNGRWEIGKVVAVSLHWHSRAEANFRYTIVLDRKSKSGNIVTIHLRDDQVWQ
jgi:hypothetical protein